MILQYLSKVEVDGKVQESETIRDGVNSVSVFEDMISVEYSQNEDKCYIDYYKNDTQIYQMWLLNDNFKTLKRLI